MTLLYIYAIYVLTLILKFYFIDQYNSFYQTLEPVLRVLNNKILKFCLFLWFPY